MIPLYAAQYTRDVVKLQRAQHASIKMTEELENMAYEQKLRELSLLSLEKQRLLQSSTTYGVGGKKSYRANEAKFFTEVQNNRTWGNGQKLQEGKFQLEVRKASLMRRKVLQWNRPHREVVASILGATLEHPEQPDLALKLALLPNLIFLCFCEFQVTSSEA